MFETRETIQPLLLRVPRAAEYLDVSRAQAYKLIAMGELEVIRVGSSIRVPLDAITDFIARKRSEGPRAA